MAVFFIGFMVGAITVILIADAWNQWEESKGR